MEARGRRRLRRWYRLQGRHQLPWRLTRDPYAVLVSEVMLQQTQVERVVPYYEGWLARWPDARTLAAASPADVIRAWGGPGYNRRAVQLHRAVCAIVEANGGAVPTEPASLARLPGIGPYTAAAVACFAGGRREVVLDTNVARVVARGWLGVPDHRNVAPRTVRDAAEALLPWVGARDHNLALMDLGAMVCRAREPRCEACPLRDGCEWRGAGYLLSGSASQRTRPPRFEETTRFARGRILQLLRTDERLTAEEIAAELPAPHRRRCGEYLAALERDGLVTRHRGAWTLP